MRKTMVYLNDEQYLLLKRESEATRMGMAEIIRKALSNYFGTKKKKVDYFSFVGIADGPPNGRTSELVEDILREELR